MTVRARFHFLRAATGAVLALALSSCIGLQSPSGQGPQWVARMKANNEARQQQEAYAATGAPGEAGAAAAGGVAPAVAGATAGSVAATLPPSQSRGGFFGVLNGGDAPGIPQRPRYDSGRSRAPITEATATTLPETAPMAAVMIDPKTGYPISASASEDARLPLPQEGLPVGAPVPPEGRMTPAPPVPMDPKDIKTGTRGNIYGRVRSPYPPYLELDASGVLPGSLARDPATGKVFRIP